MEGREGPAANFNKTTEVTTVMTTQLVTKEKTNVNTKVNTPLRSMTQITRARKLTTKKKTTKKD